MLPDAPVLGDQPADGGAEQDAIEASTGVRGWVWALAGSIVLSVAMLFAIVLVLHDRGGSTDAKPIVGQQITYLVPSGTGARIDAGEKVEIIPTHLSLHAGDTLVLVNNDNRMHNVGGYQVRAGDTLRITYPRPGLYMNACSVNTGSLVYINVTV